MKILITSDWYAPVINGVVTSVKNLETELRRRGHEVKILTLSGNHTSYRDGEVYYVRSVGAGRIYPNARVSFCIRSTYLEELTAWKPDIIHSQCEFTTYLFAQHIARRTKAPLVHTYHTIYEDYTHYFSPNKTLGEKAVAVFSRKVLNHTDAVIAPTEKVRKLLIKYRVEPGIFTVPTGIDLGRFAKARRKCFPSTRRLVTVGRLAKEKNIEEILTFLAEERGRDYEYLIVGDGPHREALEELTGRLGLTDRVHFAGMVDPQRVADYYRQGDVFVCASNSETQGLTYVEALASALPAVCRRDACLDGVIIDGCNGWQYEDEDGFFDALEQLFSNKIVYETASAYALIQAKKFSKEAFAENIEAIYRTVLTAAARAAAWEEEDILWERTDRRHLRIG